MKYLVVGLGNIGEEYTETRHNIGFSILDTLNQRHDSSFNLEKQAELSSFVLKGKNINLIKPSNYVNNSGKAVNFWLQKKGVKKENMLIILDDLALPFGKIRIKNGGSHGGHNGLKSINEHLGDNNYPRLRFGIANNFRQGQQSNYVLGKFNNEEKKELNSFIEDSCDAVESFILQGLKRTMNTFN
jgi:PTH1 family peptidyl-tRNA hydrolase